MTPQEEVELEVKEQIIKTNSAEKLERDLMIGRALIDIFDKKLFRSAEGGRTWEQYLQQRSADLFMTGKPIDRCAAQDYRALSRFTDFLEKCGGRRTLPMPTSRYQLRPMAAAINAEDPTAALEIWKAACAEAKSAGRKGPTHTHVQVAASRARATELAMAPVQERMAIAAAENARVFNTEPVTFARPEQPKTVKKEIPCMGAREDRRRHGRGH